MAEVAGPPPRAGYGIDAPGLVRGFLAAGAVGLIVAVAAALSPWPAGMTVGWSVGAAAVYPLAMGCYMLYGSLVGKVRGRERLLDLLPWSGTEAVLDVGCGRGLMLVAAARRVPAGRAVGVDVWQAEDQSGNRPEVPPANARAEGVADRVEVQTADARRLPFPDGSFDAVVSHWVVHNLYAPADRAQALGEMARVLKPGGHVLIADIQHHAEYADRLRELGFADVRRVASPVADAVRRAVTFGSFRPGAVVGRKPDGSR
jgi:ubiquinone/menaquinone biosynthesis C-methylase UbiE